MGGCRRQADGAAGLPSASERGRVWPGRTLARVFMPNAPGLEAAYGAHVLKWGFAFGQASNSDQTKSRRIQAFDGKG